MHASLNVHAHVHLCGRKCISSCMQVKCVWVNSKLEEQRMSASCGADSGSVRCRLGLLVWQDTPVMYWEDPFNDGIYYRHPKEKEQHMKEMAHMIEVHSTQVPAPAALPKLLPHSL